MEKNDGTKLMDNDLYEAAVKGDSTILANATVGGDECTETKANLIHIAVRHERYDFIETALGNFSYLVCQRNSDNNTPFHIAAEVGNTRILELLVSCYNKAPLEGLAPWREKNLEGNTPLHVALIHAKLQLANNLVTLDPELTAFVNKSKETPLHLAIRYRFIDDDRESVFNAMKLVRGNTLGGVFRVQSPPKENSQDIIATLLKTNPSIACWRDSNGFTPLLRAALFKIPDMSAIQSILKCCPRSIEVCDNSGKTFFHLLAEHSHHDNSEYLFSIRETIHSLKDRRDFKGNTPSYLAVKNGNISMVRLLFRVSANFTIKNKEGVSAADLLRQQSDEFHNLLIAEQGGNLLIPWTRIEKEEERLQNLLSKLQQKGTIKPRLFRDNLQGGNVLHELTYLLWRNYDDDWPSRGGRRQLEDDDVQEFMKQALDSCPALICETDIVGGTPLHLIAHYFHDFIDESVLGMFSYYFKKFEDESGVEGLYLPPWRMKDKDGNTPLHTALRSHARLSCFRAFLKFDPELATYQNKEMETPLHLLDHVNLSATSIEEVQDLTDPASEAACLYDNDGLTPLLKAAKYGDIPLVKLVHLLYPSSVDKKTKNDQKTFWHLLASQTFFDSTSYRKTGLQMLLEIRNNHTAMECLAEADNDGNTPLHIAIEKRNFHFARFVMEIAPEDSFENIMRKRNSKDLTPIDLIGSAEYVPRQFENFIWSKHTLMKILLGARSLSGVPTAMVKDYTNTIGVIAALFATITFTAAFTVPGGLNSNDGTPFLMRKAAFQVFMVSDILAMCLSMMVLFCLLWTMGNQKERVVILDLAIFLLELAFYATVVAFMTGLYVTTFPIASWVAIFACTLCSLLILLMRERFVTSAIRPVIKIAFVSKKVASSVKEFLYLLLCCVPKREMMRCSEQPSEIQKLKLKLHEHELVKTWRTKRFTPYHCRGCNKPVSNWSFCCNECECEFDLHPECALTLKNREEDVMFSWIPKRIVTCCSEQPNETNDGGHRSPTHGDAHAEQVAPPSPKWRTGVSYEKLKLKLHEHELVQMWRGQYGCDGCRNRGFNWSFYCKACDFDLHPECALKNDEKVEGECSKEVEATDEGFAKDDEIKAEANEGNTHV